MTTLVTHDGTTAPPGTRGGGTITPNIVTADAPYGGALEITQAVGVSCGAVWGLGGAHTQIALRAYLRTPATWSDASQDVVVAQANAGGAPIWRVTFGGTGDPGQLRWVDAAAADAAVSPVGTLVNDTWYRVEVQVDHINGTGRLLVYGDDTGPALWDSGAIASTYGTDTGTVTIGPWVGGRFLPTMHADELAITDEATLVGPAGTGLGGGGGTTEPPPAATAVVVSRLSGGVTDTTAVVAANVTGAEAGASVRLAVATDEPMTTGVLNGVAQTVDAQGYVKLPITGLTPDTDYFYAVEFLSGGTWTRDAAMRGRFHSFPTPGAAGDFDFVHGHCHSAGFNQTVWEGLAASPGAFFLHCGDMHYADINDATDDEPTRDLRRAEVQQHFNSSRVAAFYGTRPMAYVWDDHDSCGNNTDRTSVGFPNAAQVYRQTIPHYPLSASDGIGIWQEFVYGRVHFILLDTRSQRDPITDPDDGTKTLLGAEQKQWLMDTMTASPADLFVIMSGVPWNDNAVDGDAWGRYQTEQDELIGWWTDNGYINSIFIINGDMHGTAADDGTNSPGGIPVVIGGALGSAGSTKGGPYSHASIEGNRKFGHIAVADTGDGATLTFSGQDHPDAVTTTLVTMAAPLTNASTPATFAGFVVWDGAAEVTLTLEGLWDGAQIVPLTYDTTT